MMTYPYPDAFNSASWASCLIQSSYSTLINDSTLERKYVSLVYPSQQSLSKLSFRPSIVKCSKL